MAGMILSIITFLPAVAALILLVFLRDDDEAAANNARWVALDCDGHHLCGQPFDAGRF